ncbi:hypothetical protein I4641_15765, partial [Waterburya agarophytonicola K14]|nr:hypothetical protein [Waterburya agarophytonicola KI4]
MWNRQGQLLHTIENQMNLLGEADLIGNNVVSRDSNGNAKLFNLQGQLIKEFIEEDPFFKENAIFSPDGEMIVTSRSNTVKLWNIEGKLLRTLTGHTDEVQDVAFSPDGEMIASASNNTVYLWNTKGKLLHTFKISMNSIEKLNFSPNGKIITTENSDYSNIFSEIITGDKNDNHTAKLWNLKGDLLQSFQANITFSPDGEMIASVSNDTVKLWNIKGKLLKTFNGHTSSIENVAFSPDGEMIASVSNDTVKLWNIEGDLIKTETIQNIIPRHLNFSPDGNTLIIINIINNQNHVNLWNLKGEKLAVLEFRDFIKTSKISSDGQIIAFSSDTKIEIWDFKEQVSQTFEGHKSIISDFEFSPNSKLIASTSWDGTIKLWNLKEKALATFHGNIASGNNGEDFNRYITFSTDSKTVAFINNNNNKNIKIWDQQGKLLHALNGHTDDIYTLVFSPDGKKLVSASEDGTAKVWNQQGELLYTLNGHTDDIYTLVFSPDGKKLVSASEDGTAKVW